MLPQTFGKFSEERLMKAWRAVHPLTAGAAAPRPGRTYRGLAAGAVTGILAAGVASFAALGSGPSNGGCNFGPGDSIVSFAKAHNMRVRGHNLVWHSQLPSWVSSLPLSQVQSAMETHITTEMSHYKGQVYAWDVVNEPFNDDGTLRSDVFYQAMGQGYIADALRTAHAADPTAKLYLNDYNIEGENAKSNAMYNLVSSLKAQGVPIDGVGLESHFIVGQVPSSMLANMQRFAALGVDVAVTELDDRIQLPTTTASLNQQASDYATVVKDCLAVSRCVGVSQWGVGDADSWIPGTFSGY